MRPARSRFRARGALFTALALGLLAIAWAAASAEEWVIAVAAAAIGVWMADLARRDLGPRRGG
jgi:VanZ family protein